MKFKYNNEYIDDILKDRFIIRLEDSRGVDHIIKWKCTKDGHEWKTAPNNIINNGNGCAVCAGNIALTNEIIDKRIEGRGIKRLDDVNGALNKIRWQCLLDSYVWEACPNQITNNNSGCPKCTGHIRLTNELVDNKLQGRNITRLDDVNGISVKIRWRCEIDGFIWSSIPNNVINKFTGCPKCAGNNRVTNELVDKRLQGRNIKRLDDINGAKNNYRWQCELDGHIWYTCASHIINDNSGCPICKASKGELLIKNWLISNNVSFIQQMTFDGCKNIKLLPFDFYLPDHNALIEYDGQQHYENSEFMHKHRPLNKQLDLDYIKTRFARISNIRLFRVPYDFNSIEINNILLSIIK